MPEDKVPIPLQRGRGGAGGAMHPWAMLLVAQDLPVSAASQAAGQLREPHLPQGLLEGSPQEWQFCACPLGVFRDLGLSQQGLLP